MKANSYLEKLDRSVLIISDLDEKENEAEYWRSKPVKDRMITLEILRQRMYGTIATTARLQRIFEIAEQI